MKSRLFTAIAFTAMAIISCTEDTESIGSSVTNETDKLIFSTGVYNATSRSIFADSVYSKSFDCYLGKVKDPETNSYVKNEFMAQFNMLENFYLPEKSTILSVSDGDVAIDSCEIWLVFDRSKCYGDSLTPLKIKVQELAKPVEDGSYYSNFNPAQAGYLREDGLKKSTSFTLSNLQYSDSIRKLTSYSEFARITLNDPYTDKEGNVYNNIGTYIMRQYYQHPEYFKNSYSFIHSLMPGFNFEITDGMGVMANVAEIDMNMYYSFKTDTTYYTSIFLSSTPEVLQTSYVVNDRAALEQLVNDNSCTYLKSPAGIFTEVTLPVDEITQAHTNDSLLSVSISFMRQNSDAEISNFPISKPSNILMVHKDSLYSFFENKTMYDYKISFKASLDKTNDYTFNNIGNLITLMAQQKTEGLKSDPNWVAKHPDWNKVVLVPISLITKTSYDYYGYATTTVSGLQHQLGLSSTKLVGGSDSPISVKVIYGKFKE